MSAYRGIYTLSSNPELLNHQEFSDTLSYIASLRDRAEPYGICCVVPPPSWKPPCLLKEKKICEASSFAPQVQLFGGIHTENPKIKKEVDVDSDDAAIEEVKFCGIQTGPSFTLEKFKGLAASRKKNYFNINDEVLGSKNSSPSLTSEELTVADIEKEYRQLVESPLVENEVMLRSSLLLLYMKTGYNTNSLCKLGALWK